MVHFTQQTSEARITTQATRIVELGDVWIYDMAAETSPARIVPSFAVGRGPEGMRMESPETGIFVWTPSVAGSYLVSLDVLDPEAFCDGEPCVLNSEVFELQVGVEVDAGLGYGLRASLRYAPVGGAAGIVSFSQACEFFADAQCAGEPFADCTASVLADAPTEDWPLVESSFTAPSPAASALCRFEVRAILPTDLDFDLYLDGLFLGLEGCGP